MQFRLTLGLSRILTPLAILVMLSLATLPFAKADVDSPGFYQQTNLVSDLPNVGAQIVDLSLVNSWGLVHGPTTPWWVADNGTGVSTLYNTASANVVKVPLTVTIPAPEGSPAGTTSAPTGVIFNGGGGFNVSQNGQSFSGVFIFDTEDGTISGWNPTFSDRTHAVLAVDRSEVGKGAVYKGLAIGTNSSGTFIYATNFRFGTVEMFDSNFELLGSFTDHRLPQSYAPFGIQNIGGNLYVTFAKQNGKKHDDVAGPGNGFVDVFDTNGNLISRLIARGSLNSPWGLALAPADFGQFSNDLLVGNFGDGVINAFDPNTGVFLGQLSDQNGNPIMIDGLWSLQFGNNAAAGPTNELFFTAGIDGEAHGLFGNIQSKS
jgi:uncharacterized protein (TIGR03118 family)